MSLIHRGLTFSLRIEESLIPQVNQLLEDYNADQPPNESLCGTFFISWLTVPTQVYAGKEVLPARVIFMSSYVGNKRKHVDTLVNALGDKLRKVFAFSDEYPQKTLDSRSMARFIVKKSSFNAFYSGFKFVSTGSIASESQLRSYIFKWVEKQTKTPAFSSLTPSAIKSAIEKEVEKHPSFSSLMDDPEGIVWSKWKMLAMPGLFVMLMVASLLVAMGSIWWDMGLWGFLGWVLPDFFLLMFLLLVLLRKDENLESPPIDVISDEDYLEIVSREKNKVVNEMTVIAPLKPGRFRRIFLAVSLRLVAMVRYFAYIPTVHTARWLQLDRGKRLVFIATFDNQSEAYAHDFVDSEKRSRNLAVIFSHVMGFPKTTWLIHKGSDYRKDYMKGVRSFQFKTGFWYTLNRELSVENLKNNRAFRLGLNRKMKDEDIRKWLLRL